MELLQIIIITLKLFALSSLTVVALSYSIYKIKDSKRLKPYMRPSVPAAPEAPAAEKLEANVITEEDKNVNSRFMVLNDELLNSVVEQEVTKNKVRFKKPEIVNEMLAFAESPSFNRSAPKGDFNVFNYYSNSLFEPMHKLKN